MYIVVCTDPNGDNPDFYIGPYETLEEAEEEVALSNVHPLDEDNNVIGCPNDHNVAELLDLKKR